MTARRAALIAARKAKGWSQERLAALVGVSRTAYLRWEAGDRTPRLDEAIRLAALLGRTVEELFGPDLRAAEAPVQDGTLSSGGKVAQAA